MTCGHCAAAAKGPHYVFKATCPACQARDIARGPVFFHRNDSEEKAREYRELLARVRLSPAAVMRASQADKERAPA